MNTVEWLQSLKRGDKVIVYGRTIADNEIIETVARVTRTQIVLADGSKHRKKDGYRCGYEKWRRVYIEEPTPERVAEIRLKNDRRKVARRIERQHKNLTRNQCDIILAMEIPE